MTRAEKVWEEAKLAYMIEELKVYGSCKPTSKDHAATAVIRTAMEDYVAEKVAEALAAKQLGENDDLPD